MSTKTYIPFLFLVILTQFACEKTYVEPLGLLDGYSFETDPIEFSSNSLFLDDYTLSWTDEDAFDGTNSLRMISGQKDNQSFAYWHLSYDDFALDQPFRIKVRVKTMDLEGNGGAQVNMFARSKDGRSNLSSSIGDLINSTNGKWETIELSLDSNPSNTFGAIDIYFLLNPGSTGTVYWDKLEIFTGE